MRDCRTGPPTQGMVHGMRLRIAAVLLVLVAGYLAFNYFLRPIPAVAATVAVPSSITISAARVISLCSW